MERRYMAAFTPVDSLTGDERAEMAALYLRYYENADEKIFFRDLDEKNEVDILRCDGRMVGFSTLLVYTAAWEGREIRVVYSGDTIVERDHWGQQVLPVSWLRRASRLHREKPEAPLYWFLLVKGHRTYRYMPLFLLEHHPANADATHLGALADKLAGDRYPADYNPATGVVEFARSHGNLRDAVAHPTARERKNPVVRQFLEKNPGYLRGHELVCLCRLSPDNLRPFARRIFEGASA